MKTTTFKPYNLKTYGTAFILDRRVLRVLFIAFCVVTPFSNWLIAFSHKIIKNDIKIRWNK